MATLTLSLSFQSLRDASAAAIISSCSWRAFSNGSSPAAVGVVGALIRRMLCSWPQVNTTSKTKMVKTNGVPLVNMKVSAKAITCKKARMVHLKTKQSKVSLSCYDKIEFHCLSCAEEYTMIQSGIACCSKKFCCWELQQCILIERSFCAKMLPIFLRKCVMARHPEIKSDFLPLQWKPPFSPVMIQHGTMPY